MRKRSIALEKITRFSGFVSIWLSILMIILVLFDALARYLFEFNSISLQELEWHLFSAMFLLAIPIALKHDSHVRLDIFYQHYSPKTKHILWIVVNLVFIIPFSVLIVYYGYDFFMTSYSQHEVSDSGGLGYRFIIKSMPSLAFSLLIVQSIAEILKSIMALKEKRPILS